MKTAILVVTMVMVVMVMMVMVMMVIPGECLPSHPCLPAPFCRPMMVITQKITSLAFEIHDGKRRLQMPCPNPDRLSHMRLIAC